MRYSELSGKTAIVTGGTGSLAGTMAKALVDSDVKTVVIDVSKDLQSVADDIGAIAVRGDLASADGCEGAFDEALTALNGKLDIIVNAVGIGARFRAEDFPLEAWREVLSINLSSYFYMSRLAGRVMILQGGGRIINIGSMTTFVAVPDNAAYCSAKGAVGMLTKSLARDWGPKGINVNCIAPGFMDTKLNKMRDSDTISRIPLGRLGVGEDLVGPLLFLCSSDSDYITGAILPVDGGYLCN